MMTKKQALIKDGFPVSEGRGRLSREATARVEELVALGWDIEGYTSSKPKSATEPVAVKKVPVSRTEKVVQEFVILYDVDKYKAVTSDGREYTMREVCNNCGVSLVQNHCDSPRVLHESVTILPRV
jgi:hypothetical protein